MPLTSTRLSRDFSPETMRMLRRGSFSVSERNAISASFAAPSTGGTARRMRTASPRMPSTRVRGDRGMTRIESNATGVGRLAAGLAFLAADLGGARGRVGLARTVEQDLV